MHLYWYWRESAGCPLNSEGFVTDEQLEMLLEKGVAAELLGHFIQANGERLSTAWMTHTPVFRVSLPK